MKKLLIIGVLILIQGTPVFSQEVNGDFFLVDGKKILRLWGTHYERGFAAPSWSYYAVQVLREPTTNLFEERFIATMDA